MSVKQILSRLRDEQTPQADQINTGNALDWAMNYCAGLLQMADVDVGDPDELVWLSRPLYRPELEHLEGWLNIATGLVNKPDQGKLRLVLQLFRNAVDSYKRGNFQQTAHDIVAIVEFDHEHLCQCSNDFGASEEAVDNLLEHLLD